MGIIYARKRPCEGHMIYINMNILDLNDNKPEFLTSENPVEISVSSHLETGELIAKMEVRTSDNFFYIGCYYFIYIYKG